MAGAISVSRNFSVLMDINHHFEINSCSHGVKIEVKQIDDNDSCLYNKNKLLYVELSDF